MEESVFGLHVKSGSFFFFLIAGLFLLSDHCEPVTNRSPFHPRFGFQEA